MVSSFIRAATRDELKEYIEIKGGDYTPQKQFERKLAETEKKYTKLHLPFCARCAQMDYEDLASEILKEARRQNRVPNEHEVQILNNLTNNFDKYADPDRFELLSEEEWTEDQLNAGLRTRVVMGYQRNYICKVRKCGHTVFAPIDHVMKDKGLTEIDDKSGLSDKGKRRLS